MSAAKSIKPRALRFKVSRLTAKLCVSARLFAIFIEVNEATFVNGCFTIDSLSDADFCTVELHQNLPMLEPSFKTKLD